MQRCSEWIAITAKFCAGAASSHEVMRDAYDLVETLAAVDMAHRGGNTAVMSPDDCRSCCCDELRPDQKCKA
jgi:hypothetical protein